MGAPLFGRDNSFGLKFTAQVRLELGKHQSGHEESHSLTHGILVVPIWQKGLQGISRIPTDIC